MKRCFWLVTTNHLEARLWFKDEDDFKVGMNYVALLSATMQVKIVAFILMSNHVHFILICTKKQAVEFINRFKDLYASFVSRKYSSRKILRRCGVDIQEINPCDDSFERTLAYVHMNSVAANICVSPADYPWGTGDAFFNPSQIKGVPLGQMSGRAVSRMIHSRQALPPEYIVDERGFIDPRSYVQVRLVESIFRSPKRMNFFLQSSSKAKLKRDLPSFSDQVVSKATKELVVSLFHVNRLSDLNGNQMSELFKQVRYRFSSDAAQIARTAEVSQQDVVRYLEMI